MPHVVDVATTEHDHAVVDGIVHGGMLTPWARRCTGGQQPTPAIRIAELEHPHVIAGRQTSVVAAEDDHAVAGPVVHRRMPVLEVGRRDLGPYAVRRVRHRERRTRSGQHESDRQLRDTHREPSGAADHCGTSHENLLRRCGADEAGERNGNSRGGHPRPPVMLDRRRARVKIVPLRSPGRVDWVYSPPVHRLPASVPDLSRARARAHSRRSPMKRLPLIPVLLSFALLALAVPGGVDRATAATATGSSAAKDKKPAATKKSDKKGDKKAEKPKSQKSETYSGLKFRNIGPALTSGRVADLAIPAGQPQVWYVAVASGGVWKTTNAGTTFNPIFDGEGSYSIVCVTVDPRNPLVVWIGTGENNSQRSVGYGDGIYRSLDGGKNWENLGLKESQHIAKIVVHPNDSNVIYAAAQGPLWSKGGDRGLYKSA